jgi:hypothetical protein
VVRNDICVPSDRRPLESPLDKLRDAVSSLNAELRSLKNEVHEHNTLANARVDALAQHKTKAPGADPSVPRAFPARRVGSGTVATKEAAAVCGECGQSGHLTRMCRGISGQGTTSRSTAASKPIPRFPLYRSE